MHNSYYLKNGNIKFNDIPVNEWYKNESIYKELVKLFDYSLNALLKHDSILLRRRCSERTICGALMLKMYNRIQRSKFRSYYPDVEFNRNKGGKIKTINTNIKTLSIGDCEPVTINCDLILHSRGEIIEQDNLIAIEIKKSYRSKIEKDMDRMRLMALTRDSYDEVWSFDGKSLPEHVCRYILGIYIEINDNYDTLHIEYYRKGNLISTKQVNIPF